MKAVIFREHGGVEKLEYTDMPEPKISANEVLVRVCACALKCGMCRHHSGLKLTSSMFRVLN